MSSETLSNLLFYVGQAAIRSLAVALLIGVALRIGRIRQIRFTLAAWTAVLYVALAMPALTIVLPILLPRVTVTLPAVAIVNRLAARGEPSPGATGNMGGGASIGAERAAEPSTNYPGLHASLFKNTGRPGDYNETPGYTNPLLSSAPAAQGAPTVSGAVSPKPAKGARIPWRLAIELAYALVAIFLLARIAAGLALSSRLRSIARPITDTNMMLALDRVCDAMALPNGGSRNGTNRVAVAESPRISVPVCVGLVAPAVLLPLEWRVWEPTKLEAVLAHELSHVRRRDGLTQLLSALHRGLFWFSPLSWWLHRRLLELSEEASDESALAITSDRPYYAEVLLGFVQSVSLARGRWMGVSMAHGRRVSHRVERILNQPADQPGLKRSAAAVIVVLAIPAVFLAASLRVGRRSALGPSLGSHAISGSSAAGVSEKTSSSGFSEDATRATDSAQTDSAGLAQAYVDNGDDRTAPPPPAAPQTPQAPPPPAAPQPPPPPGVPQVFPALSDPQAPPAPAAPQPPDAAPPPPAPAFAPPAPQATDNGGSFSGRVTGRSAWVAIGTTDFGSYAIVINASSVKISGSSPDAGRASAALKKMHGDFIWFSRGGQDYVITDPATVQSARELFSSLWLDTSHVQDTLNDYQEALRNFQAAFAGDQAESRGQSKPRVNVPDVSAEIRKIEEGLKGAKTPSELSDLQAKLSELQAIVSELQAKASEQDAKVRDLQAKIREEQARAREQQANARAQRASTRWEQAFGSDAAKRLTRLLDEALRKGIAKPAP